MRLLQSSFRTLGTMGYNAKKKHVRLDFETNIALEVIPSTIKLDLFGAHTAQLRIDGILTAKCVGMSHENMNLDYLKKLIASGDVELELVNKAAPIDWHKVAIEREKHKNGPTGDEWMKGTRGPSDSEMRQDGDTAMSDI
jgi:hypothetical protein